jgi:XTP/dITP diphosphohydrolase
MTDTADPPARPAAGAPARLRLAVATSNPGKLAEFAMLLAPLDCDVVHGCGAAGMGGLLRGDMAFTGPVEDGETFYQNAYIKARFWADALGVPCLADDSGLLVRALGGEPGVRSARWGGPFPGASTGRDQSAHLVKAMEGEKDRKCAFAASLVLAKPFRREALHYQGALTGEVACELKGANGFGFDYVFLVPELGRTLAELSPAAKGEISHRGRAVAAMREDWERVKGFLAEYAPRQ